MTGIFCPDIPRETGTFPDVAVIFCGSRILIRRAADGAVRLPRRGEIDLPPRPVLQLGRIGTMVCGAVELPAEMPISGGEWCDLRPVLTALPPEERIAAGRGRELLIWRTRQRFCGLCGAVTSHSDTECALVCAACGAAFFPVLAPAVIVLIKRNDEILLAHNRRFANRVHGLIAGFVEAGESVEECIRREIREEIRITVDDCRYFGSQCWPYPNSLMLGFTAAYSSGEITPDGTEIECAGWFRRDNLPEIPAPGSIARSMIDAWLDGRI